MAPHFLCPQERFAGAARIAALAYSPSTPRASQVRQDGWDEVGRGVEPRKPTGTDVLPKGKGVPAPAPMGPLDISPVQAPFSVLSHLPRVDARSINSAGSLVQWMVIIHHTCGFCSDVLVCLHTHSPLKVKGVPRWRSFVAQMGIPGTAPSVHPPLETRWTRNKPQKGRQSNPRTTYCSNYIFLFFVF